MSRYFSCRAIRSGISARQGGHHVAQKFTSTTLPFRSANETVLPSKSVTVNPGTSMGSFSKASVAVASVDVAVSVLLASGGALVFEQPTTPSTPTSARAPNRGREYGFFTSPS